MATAPAVVMDRPSARKSRAFTLAAVVPESCGRDAQGEPFSWFCAETNMKIASAKKSILVGEDDDASLFSVPDDDEPYDHAVDVCTPEGKATLIRALEALNPKFNYERACRGKRQ